MRRGLLAVTAALAAVLTPASGASAGVDDATLAVWPHTDLVHEQQVLAVVEGWEPRGFVDLAQCVGGATAADLFEEGRCEYVAFPRVGTGGRVRLRVPVEVVLDDPAGPIDCRLEACELVAVDALDVVDRVPLTFEPSGPDPAHHPLSVTPSDDLVDQQQVTVTGEGFELATADRPGAPPEGGPDPPPRQATVVQCVLPFASFDDCGGFLTVQLSTSGALSTTYRVDTRLTIGTGASHNCREGGCVLAAFSHAGDRDPSEIARVPLTFDPEAPAPEGPDLHLEPGGPPQDGQVVDVVGSHFTPRGGVSVLQCRAGATSPHECQGEWDGKNLPFDVRVGADGTFRRPLALRAVIRPLYRPAIDCRVESCAVIVTAAAHAVTGAPQVRLDFAPDTPLLDGRVEVATRPPFVDGRRVGVRLRDLYPTRGVAVLQCVGRTATDDDRRTCDPRTQLIQTADRRPHSDFGGTVVVHRRIRTRAFGEVSCLARRCHLHAIAFDSFDSWFGERLVFRRP